MARSAIRFAEYQPPLSEPYVQLSPHTALQTQLRWSGREIISQVSKADAVVFTVMNLPMASRTNGYLLAIQGPHYGSKTCWFSIAHLADVSNVMHFHVLTTTTDEAWESEF